MALCKPQQRGHHSSLCQAPPPAAASWWLLRRKTALQHRQLVGPLGWVPSGTKRGGEGREKRRELKWNTWIWVGNEFCSSLKLPRQILLPVSFSHNVFGQPREHVIQTPNNALHCSIRTLTSQCGFPWAPSLFDGGRDEQIFLDKCPWTTHGTPLLLLGLSLSFPCKSPPLLLTLAVSCSAFKAVYFCNEGNTFLFYQER